MGPVRTVKSWLIDERKPSLRQGPACTVGPSPAQGTRGVGRLGDRGQDGCGAPFSDPRSPREPCHPEGAFRWSSSWGFALQDCLRGGWAGYSFGPPARQVFGPRPAAPVSRFLGSGWTVSRTRSGPRIRHFGVLGGGVHSAEKGTSAGPPGGVTCWPGKRHDWPANPTAFRPPFSALAGPPTGLTVLPGRRNFQNGKGAQKGGFGTGEIQKRVKITYNFTANTDAKFIGVVGALGMMGLGA